MAIDLSYNEPQPSQHIWQGTDSDLCRVVLVESEDRIGAYLRKPSDVKEHFGAEAFLVEGGYHEKQIYELVQNASDALASNNDGGTVKLVLTDEALYCADDGQGMDEAGVKALLAAHISEKKEGQIGRFGLGFKSILEISDAPQVFSFPGSFEFNKAHSKVQINKALDGTFENVPVLRLAWPVDPKIAQERDQTLNDLMTWASTIIKAPLNNKKHQRFLFRELDGFPEQFLLFTEHVNQLILEIRTDVKQEIRIITRSNDDESVILSDSAKSQSESAWNVFTSSHNLSAEAKADATAQHKDRGAIPIVWAVSRTNPGSRGQFWTFFPSSVETTLTGILNAPWKTSVDRATMLDGPFNQEIMRAAAELVADSLPKLLNEESPGAILDIIPARGEEEQTDLATEFVGEVYSQIATRPSIPNQLGTLQNPSEINLPPDPTIVSRDAAEIWAMHRDRPINWSHHSVQTRDRYSKAVRIMRIAAGKQGTGPADEVSRSLDEWLIALLDNRTSAGSMTAIRAISACKETAQGSGTITVNSVLENVRIVLTESGELVHLKPGEAYLPPETDIGDLDIRLVHADLRENRTILTILKQFGFTPVAHEVLFDHMIQQGFHTFSNQVWDSFWKMAQRVPEHSAASSILGYRSIQGDINKAVQMVKVKTLNGAWRRLHECFLPGGIPHQEYEEDRALLIDTRSIDSSLVRALGGSEKPRNDRSIEGEEWFSKYQDECRAKYMDALPAGGPRPQANFIQFARRPMVGPISPFLEMSEESKVAFTDYLLDAPELFVPWQMGHSTQSNNYPLKDFASPFNWFLRDYGRFRTSGGIQSIGDCIGPSLKALGSMFPVAQISDQIAADFGVPRSFEELSELHWSQLMKRMSSINDIDILGEIYGTACQHRQKPKEMRCRIGDNLADSIPSSIVATCDNKIFDMLCQMGSPVLLVESEEAQAHLINKWGMVASEDRIRVRINHAPSSEPIPIADEFPQLIIVSNTEQRSMIRRIELVRCQTLERRTETDSGEIVQPLGFHLDDGNLLISDRFSEEEVLKRVNQSLQLGLSTADLEMILEGKAANDIQEKIEEIRKQDSYSQKLLAMIGRKAIENRLGRNLLAAAADFESELTDEKIARLALAAYGVTVLEYFKEEIGAEGFAVPGQWAGNYGTRKFVNGLGFGNEYAGFRKSNRDATLDVAGPSQLPELHDYQKEIVKRLKHLVDAQDKEKTRGMLSLPTGSGKTRVAVQAVTEWLRERSESETMTSVGEVSQFVWIAQSDELCEQAVQTFEEVWSSKGSQETLQISRLWSSNEATEYSDGPQVIVATIDKLHSVMRRQGNPYDWLTSPNCVIVDEAHRATTTEYTQVLRWLNTPIGNRTPDGTESVLLGLTATPFKGWSKEATQNLANRFGQNRLDIGVLGDDQYKFLQDGEFLAQVEQEVLQGADIELDTTEVKTMEGRPPPSWLPPGAEQRIAENLDRNKTLLDSVLSKPDDWPMIIFCASVEHSKTMAGLFNLHGVSSASLSSETDAGARRFYVEEFRKGRIRVLTNHSVLSQGFDAPSVRAIYIARPVFSPNVYQQMIGRGLRGPRNGGKEECLIINVKDTIKNFDGKLAFTEFEDLWT